MLLRPGTMAAELSALFCSVQARICKLFCGIYRTVNQMALNEVLE